LKDGYIVGIEDKCTACCHDSLGYNIAVEDSRKAEQFWASASRTPSESTSGKFISI